MSYRIFTDATADMSNEMFKDIPQIEIIPMEVLVGDETYTYGPLGNLTVGEFYRMQRDGKFAQKRCSLYGIFFVNVRNHELCIFM